MHSYAIKVSSSKMNNITRPSFRSSEKRKAKALRQSLDEVKSFGFSSSSDSPFTFSPDVTSSVSTSVVKRYLLNNERNSPPHQSNMTEGTPLFASQHNDANAAVDHEDSDETNASTLFGYSCHDDSSLASPLRRINGGCGRKTLDTLGQALPVQSLAAFGSDGTNERHCVKKRLKYEHMDDSSLDLSNPQSESASIKPLSSSSNDSRVHTDSNSETDDGTVHDEWIIDSPGGDQVKGEVKVNSSSFDKEGNNGIDILDASFTIVLSESGKDHTALDSLADGTPRVADA